MMSYQFQNCTISKQQQQQTNNNNINTRHFEQQTDKIKITKIKTGHDRFQNTEDLD